LPRFIGQHSELALDLKQIRSFIQIANLQSYSKAARVLNIAQPALSRQIQALESELRTQLLFRTTRGVIPTEAGFTLLRMGESLTYHIEQMRDEVVRAGKLPAGIVTIGMPASVSLVLAAVLLEECRRTLPAVSLRFIEGMSVFLQEWLNLGKVDIAILGDPGDVPTLTCASLVQETMVVVGRSDCLPESRKVLRLVDIAELPLIMAHGFRLLLESHAAIRKIEMNYILDVNSIALIKQLVARGVGCSVLPYSVVHEEVQSGDLIALPIEDASLKRDLVVATSAKRPVSAAVRALQRLIIEQTQSIVIHPPRKNWPRISQKRASRR